MKKSMQKLSIELLEVRALMTGSPSFPTPMPSPMPPPSSSSSALASDNVVAQYSIDGTGNNVANPTWGSVGTDLLRTAPAQYADGLSQPSGSNRPSARSLATRSPRKVMSTFPAIDLSRLLLIPGGSLSITTSI